MAEQAIEQKSESIAMPGGRVSRSFIYANFGPVIMKMLAEDKTAAAVFGVEIARKIKRYKEAPDAALVAPVMDAFLGKICPEAQNNRIIHWVCKQYLSHRHNDKPIQAEDMYKVAENLAYFDSLKDSEAFKKEKLKSDLLQYKSYAEFESTLDPFLKRKAQKEILAEEFNMSPQERAQLMAETTVLYDGPEGKVVVPHTPNASKYWGSNTKWCIAGKGNYPDGREYASVHFPEYNAKSPVIMILPKGMQDQKVALVDKTLWDSADKTLDDLPPAHQALMEQCLKDLSDGARAGIAPWIPEGIEGILKTAILSGVKEIMKIALLPKEWQEEIYKKSNKEKQRDPKLWADRHFVQAAVQQNGLALRHASEKLRTDLEIVLAAVQQNGWALQYASDVLRLDREIGLAAVQQDQKAIMYVSGKLKRDPAFIHQYLLNSDGLSFKGLDEDCWRPDDKDLKKYQIAALERMAARDDKESFAKYARHFRSAWGDPETLFAADPAVVLDKIRAEMGISKDARIEPQKKNLFRRVFAPLLSA